MLFTSFICFLGLLLIPKGSFAATCHQQILKHGYAPVASTSISHAKYFKVYHFKNFKLISVHSQLNKNNHYLLSNNPKAIKNICPNIPRIKTPVKRMVSLSTSHLPAIDLLNQHSTLKGFGGLKYINSDKFAKLAKDNSIIDVQYPPNTELIMATSPDIVMVSDPISPTIEGIEKMLRLNLPVIFNADFKEPTPLGRAEWLKFVALFFNQEKQAEEIFNQIEQNYLEIKKKTDKVANKPIVISGSSHQGIWQSSGGKSNFARLLKDAGAKYVWANNKSKITISTNIEMIFQEMEKVDIWLPQNSWKNLKEIIQADSRHSNFKVFKNKRIYNNNFSLNQYGGNDYWETGLMRPDKILADLVKIIHPQLLPKHQLIWYQKLK